jgi:hypothetical protein
LLLRIVRIEEAGPAEVEVLDVEASDLGPLSERNGALAVAYRK